MSMSLRDILKRARDECLECCKQEGNDTCTETSCDVLAEAEWDICRRVKHVITNTVEDGNL